MKSQNLQSSNERFAEDRSPPRRDGGVLRPSIAYLAYLVTGLPVAVVSFTLLLCGISVSAGLAIVWIGFPLAIATLEVARQLARFERSRLRSVGVFIVGRASEGDALRRSRRVLRDRRAWRELSHGLAVLPLSVATFSIAVTWTVGALGGLTSWLWSGWLPANSVTLSDLIGLPLGGTWSEVLLGLLFALTAVPVLRMCVLVHSVVARVLLGDGRETTKELQ